jgi:MoxR-like ATPase
VLRGTTAPTPARLQPVLTAEEVLELQDATEQVRAEESVLDYLVALVAATRRSPLLSLGVSPRGSLALLRAARARALTDGRDYLVPDDIKELAVAALAHRVMIKVRLGASGAGGMDGEAAIRAIVQDVPVPR